MLVKERAEEKVTLKYIIWLQLEINLQPLIYRQYLFLNMSSIKRNYTSGKFISEDEEMFHKQLFLKTHTK